MSWVAGSWGLRFSCTGPDTIRAATTMSAFHGVGAASLLLTEKRLSHSR
jgi:hypothetical protein